MDQVAKPTPVLCTPSPGCFFEPDVGEVADSDDNTLCQGGDLLVFTTMDEAGADNDSGMNVDRPESPSPVDYRTAGEPLFLCDNGDDDEAPVVIGRTSAHVNSILEEQFQTIHQLFSELVGQVGLLIHQVVAHFSKSFGCNNYGNFWNIYQSYFQAHRAQELARLGKDNIVMATLSKSIFF